MDSARLLNSSSTIENRPLQLPVVDMARCDLCDGCDAVCPTNAICVDEAIWLLDAAACIGCEICAVFCPTAALTMSADAPVQMLAGRVS